MAKTSAAVTGPFGSEPAGSGDAGASLESLVLDLLAATRAAAVACMPWVGRGDREKADGAAVAAMRAALATARARGRVVIGEGEKDAAPMLHAGEEVGRGEQVAFDLAVDPLEGTSFCARGLEGAISVIGAAPPGTLPSLPGYYMEKLVVGPAARGATDLDAPTAEKLHRIARATGKSVSELVIAILDKPRHQGLIGEVRATGAGVVAIPDGDVMGSLRALVPGGGVDACLGIGGVPEGVITACAARLLGGEIQGRYAPQREDERRQLRERGADETGIFTTMDLAASPDCVFVATAVTDTPFLRAPERRERGWVTRSLLVTRSGALTVETAAAAPRDERRSSE